MASKGRQITIEFLGNDKTAGSTADAVAGKFDTLGGKLKKFGAVAAAGLAAAGAGAAVAGKYFFDVGARLEQMEAKAETVFGGSLGQVEKWADRTAHAMGLTTREATGLAANFGDLLIPMGFTRKEAAKMSTDVVGLSGALSQWSGGTKSAAEVTEILNAAMLGETDGLKALGISISAAEVEAALLKKGQDKLTGSAKQQAEALAIQELIFAKSTDAQKAFAEGGSPLLTAQAKIKAAFGEMRDELAMKLVPVFAKVSDWVVGTGLPAFQRFSGWIKAEVVPRVKEFASEVSARLQPILQRVGEFITTKVMPAFRDIADVIRNKVIPIIVSLAEFYVTKLAPAILEIYTKIATQLKPIFDQLVATFRAKVLPTVVKLLNKLEEWRPTIQKVILVVAKIIGKVLEFGAAILAKVLPPAIRFAGWLIATLVPIVIKVIEWTAKIIGKVIDFGVALYNGGRKVAEFAGKVKDKIGDVVNTITGLPGKILGAIGNFGSLLLQKGKDLIDGLINGIKAKAGELVNAIKEWVTDKIPGFIKDRLGINSPSIVLTKLGHNIMDGLIGGIKSKGTALQTALQKVVGYVTSQVEKLKGLMSTRDEFANGFQGFTSSVFQADFSDPETGQGNASVEAMIAYQKEQKAKAQRLAADVRRLVKMGLSRSLIQQLAESGESGIEQIHALAQGSSAQVRQLNALNASTSSALNAAGMAAGNELYGDQIRETKANLATAKAIREELQKLLKQQDKNHIIVLKLGAREIRTSLLELKRQSGRELGLT